MLKAIFDNSVEFVSDLIGNGVTQDDLLTAVQVTKPSLRILSLLLEQNLDINARDYSGRRPIEYLIMNEALDAIQLFLDAGANLENIVIRSYYYPDTLLLRMVQAGAIIKDLKHLIPDKQYLTLEYLLDKFDYFTSFNIFRLCQHKQDDLATKILTTKPIDNPQYLNVYFSLENNCIKTAFAIVNIHCTEHHLLGAITFKQTPLAICILEKIDRVTRGEFLLLADKNRMLKVAKLMIAKGCPFDMKNLDKLTSISIRRVLLKR